MKKLLLPLLCCILLLCGCAGGQISSTAPVESAPSSSSLPEAPVEEGGSASSLSPEEGSASSVLPPEEASSAVSPEVEDPEPDPEPVTPYHYTLCFAGDVSLDNNAKTVSALNSYGLSGCFSDSLLEAMAGADIMCLNSEFAFTEGGSPLSGKTYTFRAPPSRISVLEELGVDVAVLANNHVFDYGEVGLLDTLNTFRASPIAYVGAGEDLEEASAICYVQLEDCTVAYIAGSRVEWSQQTRGATESRSGVFRTAESNELICQRIAEAKENADFVVVYEHWGTENVTWLEDYQTTSGKKFIDAGADLVVGDHPHILQGIEWYQDKPIFYSMGNYWFSGAERYTMLLEVTLDRTEDGETTSTCRLIPAWTAGGKVTALTSDSEQAEFYRYMESISVNASIDEDGVVLPQE